MLLNIKSVVTAMEKRLPVLEEHAAQRVSKIDPTTSGQRVMAISPTKSIGPIRPGASGVDLRLDNHRVAAHDLLDCTSIPRPPKPIAQGVTQDNDMIRSETERHLQLHSVSERDGVNHIPSQAKPSAERVALVKGCHLSHSRQRNSLRPTQKL